MNEWIEESELAEKAVIAMTSVKGFSDHYRSLTGKSFIDPFYPKMATSILTDIIICLKDLYRGEDISLRILFQELIKLFDFMKKNDLSGDTAWNSIVDLGESIVFAEYGTERSRNDTFDFILASLIINESLGNIIKAPFFNSLLVYKVEFFPNNVEPPIKEFVVPDVTGELELQMKLEALQKQTAEAIAQAFALGQNYGEFLSNRDN